MPEIPIELAHLPSRLRHDFSAKLTEATSGTPPEREVNFLSRALAAYAVHKLAGCTVDEAAASVVDGSGDGGIDAVYYSPATHLLWIVQSKFLTDGRGEPDLSGVTKFKAGLDNLLQGNFVAFQKSGAWNKLIPQLEAIFKDGELHVRAVLVYSGINVVSDDRRHLFEDLQRRFSADSDYLQFQICNLTTVHDWLIGADQGTGVPELELKLLKPGWVREPYETIFGLLPIVELARLYDLHGKRLIVANIRGYKGDTEVNDQIMATIRREPEHFFYLNNGLTAYCERLEVHNLDRANADEKRIRAFGISIVNGAQTLGSVAQCFEKPPKPVPNGYVFLRVISLERCVDDRDFAERITHCTNFQNQIGLRDFVALDEQQERIANQLKLSGVTYHYKDDADTPEPDAMNFNLDEATKASACLAQQADCDFCARMLANPRSLWSLEETEPTTDLCRSRYSRVFRADRSARTVWRAVQTQRLVVDSMKYNARASAGVRKAFFENCRWLILNLVFLKLRPEQGDSLALNPEEVAAVSKLTVELAEELWTVCESQGFVSKRAATVGSEVYEQTRHFRSIFSAAGDCQSLRNGLLAKLAQVQPVVSINANSQAPQPPATTES